jgi:hypothetical protein
MLSRSAAMLAPLHPGKHSISDTASVTTLTSQAWHIERLHGALGYPNAAPEDTRAAMSMARLWSGQGRRQQA